MQLNALTDETDVGKAALSLRETLWQDAEEFTMPVSVPGGPLIVPVAWHSHLGVWGCVEHDDDWNRYWCCYGLADPSNGKRQAPVVEINPPVEGRNFRCGGAFARDENGHKCTIYTVARLLVVTRG